MARDPLAWFSAEIRILRKMIESMELGQKSPVVLWLDELIPPDAVITSVEGKGLVDKDNIDLLAQDAGLPDIRPVIVLDDYEKDFVNEAVRHDIE